MIDALILDLGNVLAFHDNEKLFRVMGEAFGVPAESLRARLDGGLWHRVNTGALPGDALRCELNERLGAKVSVEQWLELWSCHFTIHEEMVRFVERQLGAVRLVLLSNTHDQHVEALRPRLPVLERFDALVLSYEVGAMKPERLIYERALEAAGTRPERAVFFDDVAGYAEAAAQVGLHGRVFTTVERCREELIALGYQPR